MNDLEPSDSRVPDAADVTNHNVAQLAQRFHITPCCRLAENLDVASRRYEENRLLALNPPKIRRALAKRMHKHVSAMLDVVREADRIGSSYQISDEVRTSLVELQKQSALAIECLKGKRGNDPNRARHILVRDLYRIYRLSIGTQRIRHESTRNGEFVDFAVEAAALIAVELSPSVIAQTLARPPGLKKHAAQ
jgi:hypothetical protein